MTARTERLKVASVVGAATGERADVVELRGRGWTMGAARPLGHNLRPNPLPDAAIATSSGRWSASLSLVLFAVHWAEPARRRRAMTADPVAWTWEHARHSRSLNESGPAPLLRETGLGPLLFDYG